MAIRVKKKFLSVAEPDKTWSSVDEFKTALEFSESSPLKNVAGKQSKAVEWFLEDGVVHAYAFFANMDDKNAAVTAYQNKVTNDSITRKYTMSELAVEEI